jgi:hypothetical protein
MVLAHLAECHRCREVVALAIPENDRTPLVAEAEPSGSWLPFPFLERRFQWGAAAATVVLVVAGGLIYRSARGPHPSEMAASHPKPEVAGAMPVRPSVTGSPSAKAAPGKTATVPATQEIEVRNTGWGFGGQRSAFGGG